MSLRDRLKAKKENDTIVSETGKSLAAAKLDFSSAKESISNLLFEKINSIPVWTNYTQEQQNELLKQFVEGQLNHNFKDISLDPTQKDELIKEIIDESQGWGPLDELVEDEKVSYILVNGVKEVYAQKQGVLSKTAIAFKDEKHLINIINSIFSKSRKKVDEKNPMAEATLSNGFYVNAILAPISLDGPVLSIKKAPKKMLTLNNLVSEQCLSKEIKDVLLMALRAKLNIVISGDKSCGKTTLLNALAAEIPVEERVITVEDFAELNFQRENTIKLQADSSSISANELIQKAQKMRPDRILIGQCDSDETVEMLQIINSGVKGVMTTVCAASPKGALNKMSLSVETKTTQTNVMAQISSAVDLIVHMARIKDGSIKVVLISEIAEITANSFKLQDIFYLNQDVNHVSNGIKPKFIERLKGQDVPAEYFTKGKIHSYPTKLQKCEPPSSALKNRLLKGK